MSARFDRHGLRVALEALGAELARQGLGGELFVVGGAAIALAYDRARLTRDVDAVFEPKARVCTRPRGASPRTSTCPTTG